MTGFVDVVRSLRSAEATLERQLASVRTALSSLETGDSPSSNGHSAVVAESGTVRRRRRRMSAAGRAKIAAAQRARWAKFHAKNGK